MPSLLAEARATTLAETFTHTAHCNGDPMPVFLNSLQFEWKSPRGRSVNVQGIVVAFVEQAAAAILDPPNRKSRAIAPPFGFSKAGRLLEGNPGAIARSCGLHRSEASS